jgi:uncharacterized protein YneF (UPF0154 family)
MIENLITFWLAVLLGVVAFVTGWMWGYAACEQQYKQKDKDESVSM